MKVQVNDAEHSQKELAFELPYEVFEKAADRELDKILPEVKIPGFRPGKAPKDIVKKQYAHKIKANAVERVINDAIQEGLTVNGVRPLSQANVKDVVFEENKPITFKALVDVFPTMKIGKYKDFDFERKIVEITGKDVDGALEAIRERQMTYEPVKDRDTVKNGDVAVIDFVGKMDGTPFQGGSAENFSLNIGSGQFIPGFEDGVVGMKTGETRDIEVTFPADYGQADLASKPAVFTVTVHEIKEKVSPKLDDEFAKDVNPNCETLDQLKETLKKGLKAEADGSTKFETFGAMLGKIVDENPFDVPYSFVKEQAERLAYNSMTQFYQMGLDPEKVGINFEMMVQRHIGQAAQQVKQALVINELARIENITVEDADVDKFLAYHADIQNRSVEDLKKELEANQQLEGIKNDVLGDKVFEYLLSVNKIKENKMTKEEFEKSKLPEQRKEAEGGEKAAKPRKTAAKAKKETASEDASAKKPKKEAKSKAPRAKKAAEPEEGK